MKRRNFTHGLAGSLLAGAAPARLWASVYAGAVRVPGDVPALTLDGRERHLPRAAVQDLADRLRRPLLLRGFEGYDQARQVLNPLIDKFPAIVVQPAGVADICTAVSFAAEHSLEIAIKCGGHSFAGKSTCDGGLQIDLSHYRGVRVDPQQRAAYVAGGSLLGQMDHECMAQGLVTTAGTVSHTGVGGLTTGGGFGRLARRFGLALDNVEAVEVVAADGKLHQASADHNPDLYWAVRGGGGNFGVVTTFRFRLHPMQRQVLGGPLVFSVDRARDVLETWGEYAPRAPKEMYMDPVVMLGPGGEGSVALLDICYSGDPAGAEAALKPLRALGKPLADQLKGVDYVALQRSNDQADPRARSTYMKNGYIPELSPALVNTALDGLEPDPDRRSGFVVQHAGGRISEIPADATAFPHRTATGNMMALAGFAPTADVARHKQYIREYWSRLQPFSQGFYTSIPGDETATAFNSNFGGNYPRLREIKKRYDPDNLFRLNANIT